MKWLTQIGGKWCWPTGHGPALYVMRTAMQGRVVGGPYDGKPLTLAERKARYDTALACYGLERL